MMQITQHSQVIVTVGTVMVFNLPDFLHLYCLTGALEGCQFSHFLHIIFFQYSVAYSNTLHYWDH